MLPSVMALVSWNNAPSKTNECILVQCPVDFLPEGIAGQPPTAKEGEGSIIAWTPFHAGRFAQSVDLYHLAQFGVDYRPRRKELPMARYVWIYLATGAVMLAMDGVWLSLMAPRLYRPQVGPLLREGFDPISATLFYLVFVAGLARILLRVF
jgi:hypothetical protein